MQLNEQQKEEARVKARQYAELMNEEYVDPYPAPAEDPNKVTPNNVPTELSDEQLLELLNKRAGITLSNLDDLKPKPSQEQIEAQEADRKSKMHIFGLTSGKFTQEQYEEYQSALANKKSLVRSEITTQLKTAYPELDDAAIEEKVANYLFENLPEDDALRVARDKEIMDLSDIKIKSKYKNIVNLANDFEQYEAGITNKANFENKVKATLPVYKSDVNTALQSLKTFSVEIPDTKNPANNVTVQLEYDEKDLKEVEDLFLTNDQIIRATKEGLTLEQIKGEANLVLMQKHLPRLISQAAKKYNATQKENYINGRKGGITNDGSAIDVHDDNQHSTLDEVYDQLLESAKQGEHPKQHLKTPIKKIFTVTHW